MQVRYTDHPLNRMRQLLLLRHAIEAMIAAIGLIEEIYTSSSIMDPCMSRVDPCMKVRIDRDADVLWIEWGDLIDSYADEVSKNVYLHYTPQGGPVALEVLFLSNMPEFSSSFTYQ